MRSFALAAALLGTLAGPAAAATPPVRHVFTIVLENESATTTFGPNSPAPYLSQTLRAQGAYLPNYHAIGHQSNDNYIAMVSGQAPNVETQADCPVYVDLPSGPLGAYGQAQGMGCVYPATVPTIASQLQGAGLTWRGYNEGMGADAASSPRPDALPRPAGSARVTPTRGPATRPTFRGRGEQKRRSSRVTRFRPCAAPARARRL